MGIPMRQAELEQTLERAVHLADSGKSLPDTWLNRTRELEDCPAATFVAAVGAALLARATDPRIDALTLRTAAGPNGYSIRNPVKTLTTNAADYGYHLGTTGAEPLNNSPWNERGRLDEIDRWQKSSRPWAKRLIKWNRELNTYSRERALEALAAFLRVRKEFRERDVVATPVTASATRIGLLELARHATIFMQEDTERGRRGQALVAAVFEAAGFDVSSRSVFDPRHIDVEISAGGQLMIGSEVKQKPVEESTALALAADVAEAGADKALLCALAQRQAPLDRANIRVAAEREHGVLCLVAHTADELFDLALASSSVSRQSFLDRFPRCYARWLEQIEAKGRGSWAELAESWASATT